MFNLDAITNKNNKDDDKKWPYRILIIGPFGSGKTNALLNLIQKQDNDSLIDKIYLYAKKLSEPKHQFLIKKREDAGIKNLDDPSAFIEYSNTMRDLYNTRELQQVAIDNSADIDYKDFLKIYRNCTKESYSFLTIDTSLPADNPMRFKKTFLDSPL